ncbi:MAG: hypothetical protein V1874_06320 [Spirochaetota bacterium]
MPDQQLEVKERYMKKINQKKNDELRAEYKIEDFAKGFVRGKYTKRIKESSNVIVLKPEVADIFQNEEAVNSALLSLIQLANKTTQIKSRPIKRIRTKRSRTI